MRRPLTAVFVKSVAKPGKYGDRHGLILQVRPTGSKYWFWRGTVRGKRVDYGIGSYPYVTLAEARQTAFEYRKLSKTGADPKALNAAPAFEEALEKVLAIHRTTWKPGSRTEEQWRRELTVYAFPHIGRKRVNEVTTADVMRVLLADHLWTEKPVVAKRLRQRIGAVMKWAVAQGFRENNPAGDAVGAVLPRHNGSTTHFRALPHRRVGEAIATVRESSTWRGIKLAFEFMVLTAARTVEVRLATWDEIDMDAARWTIPPEHMKAKREHRVPLSPRAVELLGEVGRPVDRARLPVVVPGLGGREDRPPPGGRRGGAGACREEQGRGGVPAHRPVRAPASADGRVGGVSRGPERKHRSLSPLTGNRRSPRGMGRVLSGVSWPRSNRESRIGYQNGKAVDAPREDERAIRALASVGSPQSRCTSSFSRTVAARAVFRGLACAREPCRRTRLRREG